MLLLTAGCVLYPEVKSGISSALRGRRSWTKPPPVAPAHAPDRSGAPLRVTAALSFGEGPQDGPWALTPGRRGVASHVMPVPDMDFEWDFEDSGGRADATGWTVEGTRGPTRPRCGRIDASDLAGSAAIDDDIGGDYWKGSYWPGQSGECFLDTRDERVTLVSPAFTLGPRNRYVSFLVGGGGQGGRVRLVVDGQGEVFRESGPGDAGMVRVDHEVPESFFTRQARLVIDGAGGRGIRVDDVVGSPIAIPWRQQAPLWGFVDLHNHVFNHLTSGGQLFAGRVTKDPLTADIEAKLRDGPGIEHALDDCRNHHAVSPGGTSLSLSPDPLTHQRAGFPTFDGWPKASILVHEQVYVDWLRRAWRGGLRVVQLDVGNTEFAGNVYATANFWIHDRHPFGNKTGDVAAVERTLAAVREFVRGEGRGWAEVATSSREARRIVSEGKLALVLGIEVDAPGDYFEECHPQPKVLIRLDKRTCRTLPTDDAAKRREVQSFVRELYARGVTHVIPVHLIENAFGYPAVYGRAFDLESQWATGRTFWLANGWPIGVRFRLDDDEVQGKPLYTWLMAVVGDLSPDFNPKRLIGGVPADARFSHVAAAGLKPAGKMMIDEMMRLGMLVDIQHMGEYTANDALAMAEANHYPIQSSHTELREIAFGYQAPVPWDPKSSSAVATYDTAQVERIAGEQLRSREQLERIRKLGGMVGVELESANTAARWGRSGDDFCDDTSITWGHAYRYTVDMLRGRGLAIGSDANGLAGFPEPRFGPSACRGAFGDDYRVPLMGDMAARQRNGVRYDARPRRMQVLDAGMGRFSESGSGFAYTDAERDVWEALAEAEVAVDRPTPSDAFRFIDHYDQRAPWRGPDAAELIGRYAKGFWAKEHGQSIAVLDPCPDECGDAACTRPCDGPDRAELAAYRAYPPGSDESPPEGYGFVRGVVRAWMHMQGDNPPVRKYEVRGADGHGNAIVRDFDVNLEGLAHYGMLPDWLQDNRNVGLDAQRMAPLLMGAEDYVEMWERSEKRAEAIRGGAPAPPRDAWP